MGDFCGRTRGTETAVCKRERKGFPWRIGSGLGASRAHGVGRLGRLGRSPGGETRPVARVPPPCPIGSVASRVLGAGVRRSVVGVAQVPRLALDPLTTAGTADVACLDLWCPSEAHLPMHGAVAALGRTAAGANPGRIPLTGASGYAPTHSGTRATSGAERTGIIRETRPRARKGRARTSSVGSRRVGTPPLLTPTTSR